MHAAKMLSARMQESNFLYLNGNNVRQPKVPEIITDFLNEGKENYIELRNNLSQYKDIFQYLYSNVFPEIYCSAEYRGFNLKSTFHIMFKTYKDKKDIESLGTNPPDYENVRNETDVYEQKPIKIDDFNEAEEKEIQERVEKRKIKQREVAEKKKTFLKKKKQEEKKETEKELWTKLSGLTKEFKDIREHKQKLKINSKTVLKA